MVVYSRQSPNAFKTARRNISSIVTRKCIEKREYCPIQTDATRTAVKVNPGKDATCGQSEAISVLYSLLVDPEPWLHQIVSLLWQFRWLAPFSVQNSIQPLPSALCFEWKQEETRCQHAEYISLVWYDKAKAVWEVFVQVHTPSDAAESAVIAIDRIDRVSRSAISRKVVICTVYGDTLFPSMVQLPSPWLFFGGPYVLQQPGPHISRHEWQSLDGRCGLWKERRMFEFSPRLKGDSTLRKY